MSTAPATAPFMRMQIPLEEVMYLSLCGPHVWRMYRQGLNRALLLSMFSGEPIKRFRTGLDDTLTAAVGSTTFPNSNALAVHIMHHLKTLDLADKAVFLAAPHMLNFLLKPSLSSRWQHDEEDAQVVLIDVVATFICDSLSPSKPVVSDSYRQTLADIWFAVCDAALENPNQERPASSKAE